MFLNKVKVTEQMIQMLSVWKHSGFHVFCGNRITPHDDTAMENLARYITRASFFRENMTYLQDTLQVTYQSIDGLAATYMHLPSRGVPHGALLWIRYHYQKLHFNW